jgi:hypothetical protein
MKKAAPLLKRLLEPVHESSPGLEQHALPVLSVALVPCIRQGVSVRNYNERTSEST